MSSAAQQEPAPLQVALAGNPNAGKTSIFNQLTGANQQVANYPGITVEKRWGNFQLGETQVALLDLPGTYSLTPFSPEERVARNALLEDNLDVVVVVVDSTQLYRSLVLLAQMMQCGVKVVLAMNMADEAQKAGQKISLQALEKHLGCPVVETVGSKGQGIDNLSQAIAKAAASNNHPILNLDQGLGAAIDRIGSLLPEEMAKSPAKDWLATRVLVGDTNIEERLKEKNGSPTLFEQAKQARQALEEERGKDIDLTLSSAYFKFAGDVLAKNLEQKPRADARAFSDNIDRILVHKFLGLPIFAAMMYGIFYLTFTLGEAPMNWIDTGFSALGTWITGLWPTGSESALQSLLVDGIIGGVGGVVIFLPNILLLFLGLAFLEDSGYMARAAFLMDRVMHRFGLHGKSFVPMMTGFGCSIPGIMATRTLENERDRLTTMLVLPLMSCGARLTVWMLLIPAFFAPAWRAPMLGFIYAAGILLAMILARLLRVSLLAGAEAPFVMELPPYRMPVGKQIFKKISERAWIYLRKAGTVILSISILLWFMTAYPKKEFYEVDHKVAQGQLSLSAEEIAGQRAYEGLRYSIAGRIGQAMEPVIKPMGFDWKLGTAMIGAFAAKEVFVAQVGIVYAMSDVDEENSDLRSQLARDYSPLVALSLMLFLLISTPCMATIALTARESGSWKWAMLQLGGLTGIAYLISVVVYNVGKLFV
ncbi:MAG: ferrous iron transport protein B [Myxococcota bacterium]|jgi:ferrous iron transport protein B|nr:ferrous iron transport protein B [Myxococcota bacterium]